MKHTNDNLDELLNQPWKVLSKTGQPGVALSLTIEKLDPKTIENAQQLLLEHGIDSRIEKNKLLVQCAGPNVDSGMLNAVRALFAEVRGEDSKLLDRLYMKVDLYDMKAKDQAGAEGDAPPSAKDTAPADDGFYYDQIADRPAEDSMQEWPVTTQFIKRFKPEISTEQRQKWFGFVTFRIPLDAKHSVADIRQRLPELYDELNVQQYSRYTREADTVDALLEDSNITHSIETRRHRFTRAALHKVDDRPLEEKYFARKKAKEIGVAPEPRFAKQLSYLKEGYLAPTRPLYPANRGPHAYETGDGKFYVVCFPTRFAREQGNVHHDSLMRKLCEGLALPELMQAPKERRVYTQQPLGFQEYGR